MQFGVFVDGTIDANEKAVCLEVREMVLKIEPRMVAQTDVVRGGGLIEHVETSVATDYRATYHGRASISYSISAPGCITVLASPGLSLASSRSDGIQMTQTIDVHAHILAEDTIRLMQREAPQIGPKLSDIGDRFGTLEVAGNIYRHFPRGGWDLERRLEEMAAAKVDVQVLSVCPQTFVYGQPAAVAAAFARIQNEQLARLAKARPDRFLAIATLPMQAPGQAADELRHAVRVLGLRGAQIGSNIAGKNLDDPELEPVWAAAAELGAFILLHPINVAGADRLASYYLTNLIGNPLDTTIAAASLVFGGVLERHPTLKICLAHGGGFVPYQAGRFVHGWHVRAEPKSKLAKPPTESLKRFYFDTIVHSKEALAFLVGNAGAERVLLGSDYPFDMGMPEGVSQVRSLSVPAAEQSAILGGWARALLETAPARAFA
jgi:aminocarboxymuconate-semialdehyde decarboxylase